MNNPKISILVPIYNKEKYLNRCILSVKVQSYQNWELLLINDGSSDASSNICKDFLISDDRIVYFEQNNKGVSAARNTAIELATGKYICCIDPDDYIEETLFEKCLSYMQNEIDCIVYGINKVDHKNRKKEFCVEKDLIAEDSEQIDFLLAHIKNKHMFTPIWNKMYRKEIIDTYTIRNVEGIDLFEDLIFNQNFFHYIHNMVCLSYIGYNYSMFSNISCLSHKKHSSKEMLEVALLIGGCDFRYSENDDLRYYDYSFYMNFLRKILNISISQENFFAEAIQQIKFVLKEYNLLPINIRKQYIIEYGNKWFNLLFGLNCPYLIYFFCLFRHILRNR